MCTYRATSLADWAQPEDKYLLEKIELGRLSKIFSFFFIIFQFVASQTCRLAPGCGCWQLGGEVYGRQEGWGRRIYLPRQIRWGVWARVNLPDRVTQSVVGRWSPITLQDLLFHLDGACKHTKTHLLRRRSLYGSWNLSCVHSSVFALVFDLL